MTGFQPKLLSVIIPVYNEAGTIEACIRRVVEAPKCGLDFEIIVADNKSTDGTREILANLKEPKVKVILREDHSGKGANVRAALQHVTGDIVIIQDADLEYNPADYPDVLKPFFEADADAVYGSRLTAAKYYKVFGFPNFVANKLLTWTANVLFNRIFSDIETATKAFRREVIQTLDLRSDGFEIEPEITAKLCKGGFSVFEVPITHAARSYEEGKKVRWWHFFTSLYALVKWRLVG